MDGRTSPSTEVFLTRHLSLELLSSPALAEIHLTTFHQFDAEFIRLFFSKIQLPAGAYIEISNVTREDVRIHAPADLSDGMVTVVGDTAVVKVVLPRKGTRQDASIKVSHLEYRASLRAIIGDDERRPLVCFQGTEIFQHSLATAVISGSGTGSSIGSGNFMLTNNHVVSTEEKLRSLEVWFNWFHPTCDASTPSEDMVKVRADKLLTTGGSGSLDYTLFTLHDFDYRNAHIKRLFGGLELSATDPAVDDPIYVPQHGDGGLRPMYVGDMSGSNYSRILSVGSTLRHDADTQGGSSGSPILSRGSHQLVGLHYGGTSSYNVGVTAQTLNDRLGELLEGTNERVVPEGSVKASYFEALPFGSVGQLPIASGTRLVPFDNIDIEHHEDHSIVALESLNQTTGELGSIRYQLALKTSSGSNSLDAPAKEDALLLVKAFEATHTGEVLKSWLALQAFASSGELVENRLIRILDHQYDPFVPPFDPTQATQGQMIINAGANGSFELPAFDGYETLGFVALFTGQGPQGLVVMDPLHSAVRLPVRRPDGVQAVLNLRGYRRTLCSARSMNSTIRCNSSTQRTYLKLEYRQEDNVGLDAGTYEGILPLQGQDSKDPQVRLDILIHVTVVKS